METSAPPSATNPTAAENAPKPSSSGHGAPAATGAGTTRQEPARAGEPVTAYDHLWFERRPLT